MQSKQYLEQIFLRITSGKIVVMSVIIIIIITIIIIIIIIIIFFFFFHDQKRKLKINKQIPCTSSCIKIEKHKLSHYRTNTFFFNTLDYEIVH